jgi:hypothetical protein
MTFKPSSLLIILPLNNSLILQTMKTKSKVLMLLFATGLVLANTSCKKNTPEPQPQVQTPAEDTDQSGANENNVSESVASDIDAIGGQASENTDLTTFRVSGPTGIEMSQCATVTTNTTTRTYTVDFGTNCVGADGRTRSGKLIFDYSGSTNNARFYRNPGFNLNVTSVNYVVDNYSVQIVNKTIANTTPTNIPTGTNPGTNLTWAISANIVITKPNATGTLTWTCNRTKELTNTSDSLCYRGQNRSILWNKAVVKLNGSAGGVNSNNLTYTATATNLVRDFGCSPDTNHPHRHPFVAGTIAYTPGTKATRTIDYGSGGCDLNATMTIGTHTYTVILP